MINTFPYFFSFSVLDFMNSTSTLKDISTDKAFSSINILLIYNHICILQIGCHRSNENQAALWDSSSVAHLSELATALPPFIWQSEGLERHYTHSGTGTPYTRVQ